MKCMQFSVLLMVFTIWQAADILAHGVSAVTRRGGIVVTATYDSGEPMSYARVAVSAPDAKLQFQSGRTDRNGRFCFFPDRAGLWKVRITDGMGHGVTQQVEVDEALSLPPKSAGSNASKRQGMVAKVLMGLCVLLGVTGFLHAWRVRHSTKRHTGPRH